MCHFEATCTFLARFTKKKKKKDMPLTTRSVEENGLRQEIAKIGGQ